MKGEEEEMKQRGVFSEHVLCTAVVLVPSGDASGCRTQLWTPQSGEGQSRKEGLRGLWHWTERGHTSIIRG